MRKLLHILSLFLLSVSMMAQTIERNTYQYLSVKPEADSEVSSLKKIELIYKDIAQDLGTGVGVINHAQAAMVYKAGTDELVTMCSYQFKMGSNLWTNIGVDINLNQEITEPGEYVVKIKEKTFLTEGASQNPNADFGIPEDTEGKIKYNPAIELKYTVNPNVDVTLEKSVPAIGEELDRSVYDVTLTFSDNVKEVESAILKFGAGGMVELALEDCIVKNYEIIINLKNYSEQLEQAGAFAIMMQVKDTKGKYVTYGGTEGYIFLQYMMPRDTFRFLYSDPADVAELTSLREIKLIYLDMEKRQGNAIGALDEKAVAVLYREDSDEELAEGHLSLLVDKATGLNYGVLISFNQAVTEPGNYQVALDSQVIYNDAADPTLPDFGLADDVDRFIRYNPVIFFDFTIKENTPTERNTFEMVNAEPADQSEVESLKEVQMFFSVPGGDKYIGGLDGAKVNVEVKNTADNSVASKAVVSYFRSFAVQLVLEQEITAPGTYSVTIPEGTVYDLPAQDALLDFEKYYVDLSNPALEKAIYNPEYTLTYTVKNDNPDGIEQVEVLQGEVSVYSVQGMFLRKGDAATVLNGLQKGIYIVNGKKVAVY